MSVICIVHPEQLSRLLYRCKLADFYNGDGGGCYAITIAPLIEDGVKCNNTRTRNYCFEYP